MLTEALHEMCSSWDLKRIAQIRRRRSAPDVEQSSPSCLYRSGGGGESFGDVEHCAGCAEGTHSDPWVVIEMKVQSVNFYLGTVDIARTSAAVVYPGHG